ncbi:MAG: exodeoxyribonuclease VII large subunit, partial [bacterium]|nr:exodeoxyribonuclease VII large subunit [bacterium]
AETERVFTVSDFLDRVNAILKAEDVFVRGELSGMQLLPSGLYFALKDKEDGSVLQCYMHPRLYRASGVTLEDGMEVKIGGSPNIYKPKGKLSFVAQTIELVGEGSLKKAYELLKQKLEREGLFSRKRELPEFVHRIGIITSRTGAVIDDFRRNLAPLGFQLYLKDVRVEGAHAVDEIVGALNWFGRAALDLDVIVLMRGGGSLEDLQAFNNELVAREFFALGVPTIAAIGHDRDVPIASLAGDRATSTPTAAAMLINSTWERLRLQVPELRRALVADFEHTLKSRRLWVDRAASALVSQVGRVFATYRQMAELLVAVLGRLEQRTHALKKERHEVARRLAQLFSEAVAKKKERLTLYDTYLEGVSPERNLRLGYSILTNKAHKVVRSAEDIAKGDLVRATLHKGQFTARVEDVQKP